MASRAATDPVAADSDGASSSTGSCGSSPGWFKTHGEIRPVVELGYLTAGNSFVVLDTIAVRTLFPGLRFTQATGEVVTLTHSATLDRRSEVEIVVRLHRRGWQGRGETVLRKTRATWYHTDALDLFVGPTARSIRMPWRGELARVHRPFFALEAPIKDLLEGAEADAATPCVAWLDHTTVRSWRRSGTTVEVRAVERKQFSDFILGNLRAVIEFPSEADAAAFSEALPPAETLTEGALQAAPDITRSKRIVWTPKVLAIVAVALVLIGFLIVGSVLGALAGDYVKVAYALLTSIAGISLLSWALPALLRTRRREFVDLAAKWPQVLCERSGADCQRESTRAADALRSMGVEVQPGTSSLEPVDAFLRSQSPESFNGTFALQLGLLAIARVLYLTGRKVDFWWEYHPDRRECAFRADAASLRLYPLTAVLAVWQMRDPEGLEQFAQTYARELQMRLAFRESLPAFVALGFTPAGWDAFSKFRHRLDGELAGSRSASQVRNRGAEVRETVLDYESVKLVLVEERTGETASSRFVPTFAFPWVATPVTAPAELEPPKEPYGRLAMLRVGPLTQPINVLLAPSGPHPGEGWASHDVELSGVVESASPLAGGPGQGGVQVTNVPLNEGSAQDSPVIQVLNARLVDVSEGRNAFNGLSVWRLVLSLGVFELPVVTRGDTWPTPPRTGQFFTGTVRVFARIPMLT